LPLGTKERNTNPDSRETPCALAAMPLAGFVLQRFLSHAFRRAPPLLHGGLVRANRFAGRAFCNAPAQYLLRECAVGTGMKVAAMSADPAWKAATCEVGGLADPTAMHPMKLTVAQTSRPGCDARCPASHRPLGHAPPRATPLLHGGLVRANRCAGRNFCSAPAPYKVTESADVTETKVAASAAAPSRMAVTREVGEPGGPPRMHPVQVDVARPCRDDCGAENVADFLPGACCTHMEQKALHVFEIVAVHDIGKKAIGNMQPPSETPSEEWLHPESMWEQGTLVRVSSTYRPECKARLAGGAVSAPILSPRATDILAGD